MTAPTFTLPPKHSVASLDVHAQKTFTPLCPKELPVPDGHNIVNELNAQAAFACVRIGSKEAHNPKAIWVAQQADEQLQAVDGDNVDVKWVAHSVVGTPGFELLEGLPMITEYDYFVWQGIELDMHPYGVCYHDLAEKLSTGAIEFLRQQAITHVIVGGLATDYCVKTTVLQLRRAGFCVIVNEAACRGLDPITTEAAKKALLKANVAFVANASQLKHG